MSKAFEEISAGLEDAMTNSRQAPARLAFTQVHTPVNFWVAAISRLDRISLQE